MSITKVITTTLTLNHVRRNNALVFWGKDRDSKILIRESNGKIEAVIAKNGTFVTSTDISASYTIGYVTRVCDPAWLLEILTHLQPYQYKIEAETKEHVVTHLQPHQYRIEAETKDHVVLNVVVYLDVSVTLERVRRDAGSVRFAGVYGNGYELVIEENNGNVRASLKKGRKTFVCKVGSVKFVNGEEMSVEVDKRLTKRLSRVMNSINAYVFTVPDTIRRHRLFGLQVERQDDARS